MGAFDLSESLRRAEERLGEPRSSRRPRGDRGRSRLAPPVRAKLDALLLGQERPPVRELQKALAEHCAPLGVSAPARATIYQAMARTRAGSYDLAQLPAAVREALYNLGDSAAVPGHQLAFYCLNYGGLEAISYAAGLPWLALYQAARLPGWRRRSRGLLEAILQTRGI